MNTRVPSVFSAIQKLLCLLTRQEKLQGIGIIGFALMTSMLEVLTACIVVVFAQVLSQPEKGRAYLSLLGITTPLPAGRIVFYIAIIMGAVYVVKNIIATAEIFYQAFSIQKISYHFKNRLLDRYAQTDYGFYLTRNSSITIQVVNDDTEYLFSSGMIALTNTLSEGIVFLGLISMIVSMNPSLAVMIFGIGVVLCLGIAKGILPRFYRFGQKLQEVATLANQHLLQFFFAFKEMVLLGKRKAFIEAYQRYSYQKSKVQAVKLAFNALPRMIIEVLFAGIFISMIAFLCLRYDSSVQMMGILGGYLYAGFRLMPGLNRIISQLSIFKSVIPAIERVYEEYTSVMAKERYIEAPGFQFNCGITLQGVSFYYLNTCKSAISQVTLQIQKGESIGIVGETGSGKSTLVDLILGLLKPDEGTVLVDDQYPVNSYQWHQKIGYVPQSPYLTDDTIAANIAFGEKDIDQERLYTVIEAAQLHKLIDHLPQGVHTVVGERGIRLSGGERQRIAIARALYHNPEVLIFDEATSALDQATEARLMETIRTLSQNRTVIMIAHRLTTLKDCDRIIIMDKGKVKNIVNYESLNLK